MIMILNTCPAMMVTWRCDLETTPAKLDVGHYRLLSKW